MKSKLMEHIDLIFSDAPDTAEARELKEELYQNLCDRYDDLISEGKTEAAAYGLAVSGLGDMSGIIETLKRNSGEYSEESNTDREPSYEKNVYTREQTEKIEKYKFISGILTSVAISMYILCWVPIVIIDALATDLYIAEIAGVAVMMVMIAAATALLIIKGAIKPSFMKEKEHEGKDDDDEDKNKSPILKLVSGIIWGATLPLYLFISFTTFCWHITWVIFLIAAAVENITEAVFELCGKKYKNNNEGGDRHE